MYEDEKESLFSFNRMNKYYLFPFLVPIVCFNTKWFSEPMKVNDGKVKIDNVSDENCHTYVFLYQMINSTSIIFAGLLYFVSYVRTKTDNKANIGNLFIERTFSNSSFLLRKKNSKIKDYILIFLMSLMITSYNILKGYQAKHPALEKRLYFLFFFTLINVFLFKKQIYSHQQFALGIALVGMIMIFTIFFVYQDYSKYQYIYDILLFFGSLIYSLYLVFVKYLSETRSYSPFYLLFIVGIISTVLTVIAYIIYSVITVGDLTYISNLFHCRDDMYVCFGNFYDYIIYYFLINAVLQMLIFLVCYYFSPEVFAISDIISPFMSFIYSTIKNKDTIIARIVVNSLGYIIIMIGSFIYNEIIVCNFWGLNNNTWKAIMQKGVNEYLGDRGDDGSNIIGEYEMDNDETRNTNRNTETEMTSNINEDDCTV